jgi:hypothetical protein
LENPSLPPRQALNLAVKAVVAELNPNAAPTQTEQPERTRTRTRTASRGR